MKSKPFWYISISIWVLTTAMLAYVYPTFPDNVPTHIGASGEIDSYAEKEVVFILPAINLFIILLLLLCHKYRKYLNYPIELNDENQENAYRGMSLFLSILSVIVNIIYFIIAYSFYVTKSPESSQNIILLMIGLYAMSKIFVIYSLREKKK